MGDGGADASDSEDSIGSKSGTRNECCEQLKYDRRLHGEALRCISKNKGFWVISKVGVFVGGVGGIPNILAFRALIAESGVASVLSDGSRVGMSSPALRCLWAVSINCGLNFFVGGFSAPLN